jgi:hypothetical protein
MRVPDFQSRWRQTWRQSLPRVSTADFPKPPVPPSRPASGQAVAASPHSVCPAGRGETFHQGLRQPSRLVRKLHGLLTVHSQQPTAHRCPAGTRFAQAKHIVGDSLEGAIPSASPDPELSLPFVGIFSPCVRQCRGNLEALLKAALQLRHDRH